MAAPIRWLPHYDSRLRGWCASSGRYHVEVIRLDAGRWTFFAFRNGEVIRGVSSAPRSFASTRRDALAWIKGAALTEAR